MDYDDYLKKMRGIQLQILQYIDTEPNSESDYPNLIQFFDSQKIKEDRHILKETMHLILQISSNHHRTELFYDKIDKILFYFKDEINQFFTNFEIFSIFHKNYRILYFLFKEEVLKPDISIFCFITNQHYPEVYYPFYFNPELKKFFQQRDKLIQHISKPEIGLPPSGHDCNSQSFENKRRIGENDSNVCHYIRKNNASEFASYVKKVNLSYSMQTHSSIFETNSFLLKRNPTLIEYAAFVGSNNIFKFLFENGVKLTPSIWLYAMHSNDLDIIHILEDNKIPPEDEIFMDCLLESIKNHHFVITDYFLNVVLKNKNINKDQIRSHCFRYNNYKYFPNDMNVDFNIFYDMCKYDYYTIVQMFLDANVNINLTNVFYLLFKNKVFHQFYKLHFKISLFKSSF